MVKLAVFLGGAVFGFALSASLTDEQRERVMSRIRGTTHSPTIERLAGAAHTVTGAATDAVVSRVEQAADAVASTIDGGHAPDVSPATEG